MVRYLPYGVNSFPYMWTQPALACVRHLARMGFDEFELMTMPGHLWPDELDKRERRALLDEFDDLGIRIRSLNHTGLDQNLCKETLALWKTLPDEMLRSPGLFSAAITPAKGADAQTKLLNFLGRAA